MEDDWRRREEQNKRLGCYELSSAGTHLCSMSGTCLGEENHRGLGHTQRGGKTQGDIGWLRLFSRGHIQKQTLITSKLSYRLVSHMYMQSYILLLYGRGTDAYSGVK